MAHEIPGHDLFTHPELYIKQGWSCIRIDHTRVSLTEIRRWLRAGVNLGRYDFTRRGPTLDTFEFWISDPQVAFAFKMRFG